MPNWCGNTLIVTGADGDLAAFRARVRGSDDRSMPLTFSAHMPQPDDLPGTASYLDDPRGEVRALAMIAAHTEGDWYLWRIAHWGTKWDLDADTRVEEEPGQVRFWFDTAWSPPVAWFEAVVAAHPELRFTLGAIESAVDFAAIVQGRGGEVVSSTFSTPDELRARLEDLGFGEGWFATDDDVD